MWFSINCQDLIGKRVISEEGSNFYVTDFKNVWHKFLNINELCSIFQIYNPLLEVPLPKIKEVVSDVCVENGSLKKVAKADNDINLKFESSKMNINFKFQLTLSKGHENMLYEEFIVPLLYTVKLMESEKEKLFTIIKEKDSEIEEYKRECGFIKNNFAQTKPFCEEEFKNEIMKNCLQESLTVNLKILMECIGKKFYSKETKIKKSNLSGKVSEEEKSNVESKKHKSDLKKENSQTSYFKDSVKMNHQIIKKRKKPNRVL